jgi:hypothetical protein
MCMLHHVFLSLFMSWFMLAVMWLCQWCRVHLGKVALCQNCDKKHLLKLIYYGTLVVEKSYQN